MPYRLVACNIHFNCSWRKQIETFSLRNCLVVNELQNIVEEQSMLLLTELEVQNKYFPYGPKSRLIRALLYTYTNKTV